MKIIQPSDKRELPKTGELYRHFKGELYCVCGYVINATNGADSSQMVLYIPETTITARLIAKPAVSKGCGAHHEQI